MKMKPEYPFFEAPVRVLTEDTVEKAISDILRSPGQEDAFMVLNIGDIVQKIKNWRLKMPRVKPFYAVKCNTNKTVLEVLSALGIGFDCASKTEMKKIIDLGVSPSRIIYAHTCKPKSHIRQAASLGVNLMTFDNEDELHKIKEINPSAKLVLRFRCDAAAAQCPLGMKFGANPEDITSLLVTAKSLGLNVVGTSFHVGSGCLEPQVFLRAIRKAKETFDEATSLGFSPYLLDIGGGFPGASGTSLDEISEYVNQGIDECFPDDSVQIIAEPGRYVVASAFTLLTQVTAKREVNSVDGSEPSFMYYINDGVYGSFNCILFDHQAVHPQIIQNSKGKPYQDAPLFSSTMWGPTCDSMDQIFSDINLPELEVGQWLMWKDMGAYTISAASSFNGFPKPVVHMVIPFHTWVLLEEILNESILSKMAFVNDHKIKDEVYSSVPNFCDQLDNDQDHNTSLLNLATNTISSLDVFEI
jgi:ornithine decarboxylase